MNAINLILNSARLANELDDYLGEPHIPKGDSKRISGASLDIAREHHFAILRLAEYEYFASASALLRVIFEAYIRGVWFHRCATTDHSDLFLEDRFSLGISAAISDIEQTPGFESKTLTAVKDRSLSFMHSYTHTGMQQICRRISPEKIEPVFRLPEICELVRFANTVGFLARIEMALMTNNPIIADAMVKCIEENDAGPEA